jgi:hypothetical protein
MRSFRGVQHSSYVVIAKVWDHALIRRALLKPWGVHGGRDSVRNSRAFSAQYADNEAGTYAYVPEDVINSTESTHAKKQKRRRSGEMVLHDLEAGFNPPVPHVKNRKRGATR